MSDVLKNCPFCGGIAEMTQYRRDGLRIQCQSCNTKYEQRWLRFDREWLAGKMTEHWNRRAPLEAGDD